MVLSKFPTFHFPGIFIYPMYFLEILNTNPSSKNTMIMLSATNFQHYSAPIFYYNNKYSNHCVPGSIVCFITNDITVSTLQVR